MTPLTTVQSTVQSTAQTILQVVASSVLFLAVECLLDCSGLDNLADYYEFLEHQQKIAIEYHSKKQISKAIGQFFMHPQYFQMQLS